MAVEQNSGSVGSPPSDTPSWRKAERARLLALRNAIPGPARDEMDAKIIQHLVDFLYLPDQTISFYWPLRGEPDLRPLIATLNDTGVKCALPVVVSKSEPLLFRQYKPRDMLEKGLWDIPIPAEGEEVTPDILISPVVGFDTEGYRLGYGGGFFDRTMAAIRPAPRLIGIGYEITRLPTIYPQYHDWPAELIVTEAGIFETNS